jgi:integrase
MASVERRKDGRPGYLCRWRDESGAQRKRSFGRKADADRYRAEVEHSLNAGAYVDPAAGRTTFRVYAEQWRASQPHRANTEARVRSQLTRHVYPVLGDRPLAAIRPSELQAWVSGLALAPGSVRTTAATVRAILGAAVVDRAIGRDPWERVKLPEVARTRVVPLTVDQVEALASAVPPAVRALVVVAAGTGLRQGELLGLQVRDVDFLRRTLTVARQIQPGPGGVAVVGPLKNKAAYRTIPVAEVVLNALAEHLRAYPSAPDGYVFTAPSGEPWTRGTFGPVWRTARKAAGLPEAGMHDLRHAFASILISAGQSVKVVSERLGHSNAAMTLNVYSHLWPADEDRTRQAIDAAFHGPARRESTA